MQLSIVPILLGLMKMVISKYIQTWKKVTTEKQQTAKISCYTMKNT